MSARNICPLQDGFPVDIPLFGIVNRLRLREKLNFSGLKRSKILCIKSLVYLPICCPYGIICS